MRRFGLAFRAGPDDGDARLARSLRSVSCLPPPHAHSSLLPQGAHSAVVRARAPRMSRAIEASLGDAGRLNGKHSEDTINNHPLYTAAGSCRCHLLLLPASDRGAARADLALDLRLHLRLQRLHLVELAAAQRALDAVHVVVLGASDGLDGDLALGCRARRAAAGSPG
eukprot:scaffold66302_cov57-Phaeocystis_antarctica.AAC.4